MDKITRCITHDGAVMVAAIDSTETVFTAQKIHNTSPVATAALGRLLSATSIMGAMLKNPKATINLQVAGDGELGIVTAVAIIKVHVRIICRTGGVVNLCGYNGSAFAPRCKVFCKIFENI